MVPLHPGTRLAAQGGTPLWLPPPSVVRREPRPRNGHLRSDPAAAQQRPDAAPDRRALPVPLNGQSPPKVHRSASALLERSIAARDPIGKAEAVAFAARFVADYLSWDEDDPTRRAEVLRGYLTDPAAATLGWSGSGRQRADLVLAGRTMRTSDDVIVVEVTARVVVYHRIGPQTTSTEASSEPAPPPLTAVGPSCAPPPHAPDWQAGAAHWRQIAPPITRDHTGHLAVLVDNPPYSDDHH